MLKERAREISLLVMGADQILLAVSFWAAYSLRALVLPRYFPHFEFVPIGSYLWLVLVSFPLFHLVFRHFHLYDSQRAVSFSRLALGVFRPFLVASLVLGSLIFMFQDKTYSRFIFIGFLVIYFLLILLEKTLIREILKQFRVRGFNSRNLLIGGVGPEAARIAELIGKHDQLGYHLLGHLNLNGKGPDPALQGPVLGTAADLPHILDDQIVDEVLFAVSARELSSIEPLIWKCEEVGIRVHLRADFITTLLSRTYLGEIDGVPILSLTSTPHAAGMLILKRFMDILLSISMGIILSPVFFLIAALIKLTSRGPVFYSQVRTGLNGREFLFWKFRSMYLDAESRQRELQKYNEMSGPVFKIRNDPRVTPIGRFLRRYSLDELPQLWNVLTGEMSIVGPRPPIPTEVKKYERWQRRRLSMKPGLTCLWQVNGRNEIDFTEWMKLDMQYIDSWSLGLDLKILAKTVPAVVFARGAR